MSSSGVAPIVYGVRDDNLCVQNNGSAVASIDWDAVDLLKLSLADWKNGIIELRENIASNRWAFVSIY